MTTNMELAVITRARHWMVGRLTRKGGHCEGLMGFVWGVVGVVSLLLLVMEIGDGKRKRRGACEVVVKRAMDAGLLER
jgi:hypothetical protein